jgi:RimJ/RimL family protein N-acetyltransferase
MHLRPVTIEDFNMVLEWAQDPNLDEYFRRTPPLCDWAEPSKFMQQMGDKYIVMKNNNAIGLLSMGIEDHLSRTAKWGVLLAKKDRGDSNKVNEVVKNILFDKLGCNKIFCIILSHRDGLKQNLEDAGYEHEGTLKKSCLYRGKLVDECLYSLLRGDNG